MILTCLLCSAAGSLSALMGSRASGIVDKCGLWGWASRLFSHGLSQAPVYWRAVRFIFIMQPLVFFCISAASKMRWRSMLVRCAKKPHQLIIILTDGLGTARGLFVLSFPVSHLRSFVLMQHCMASPWDPAWSSPQKTPLKPSLFLGLHFRDPFYFTSSQIHDHMQGSTKRWHTTEIISRSGARSAESWVMQAKWTEPGRVPACK